MMKKLIQTANLYVQESDWKVFAILKFCLLALGIIIGVNVPKEHKKYVLGGSLAVFIATYIPLMAKFFSLLTRRDGQD